MPKSLSWYRALGKRRAISVPIKLRQANEDYERGLRVAAHLERMRTDPEYAFKPLIFPLLRPVFPASFRSAVESMFMAHEPQTHTSAKPIQEQRHIVSTR